MNTPDATSFSFGLMAASFALAFGAFFAGRFALRMCQSLSPRATALTAFAACVAGVLCWQSGEAAWAGTLGAAAALVAAARLSGWLQTMVEENPLSEAPVFGVWVSASLAFLVLPLLGNAEKPIILAIVFFGALVGAYFTNIDGEPTTAQVAAA